jgi:hypothetical protein
MKYRQGKIGGHAADLFSSTNVAGNIRAIGTALTDVIDLHVLDN